MSPAQKIQQLLSGKPGLKAQQIAAELGLDKSEVAAALYGAAEAELVQDSSYRWWPRTRARSDDNSAPRYKLLSDLCT
jgi:predicted transcriptional regulator